MKANLGQVLSRAAVERLAIRRHGRVIAYLVPAHEVDTSAVGRRPKAPAMPSSLSRAEEERLLQLVASGDLRPSRWRRAGNPELLAGLAVLLASVDLGDREQLMALGEQLSPGITTLERANAWLRQSPLKPDRFLPMLRTRLAHQGNG
ncbi:MAG TPA: hypothetical protein VFP44_07480 [Usitatibacter sp.]|nr:hypothetical protein [Usitatibacter sp.]